MPTLTNPTNPAQNPAPTNPTNPSPAPTNPVQNPVQNPAPTNNNPAPFDPNSLSPEARRYLDQQRTQASQTARANARNELMHDENFLNEVRQNMQPQVQQSLEEQFANFRRETMIDRASARVERILAPVIADDATRETYINMLATEDVEASVQRATQFIETFNQSVTAAVQHQTGIQMQNMTTPQAPQNTITDQQRLQAAYDEAKKDTSHNKGARMSAIIREAQQKNIILK